jgi:hypothetical protein
MYDTFALANAKAGDVIEIDGDPNSAIAPLKREAITDFNILDIASRLATQLTGVSEYNS